MRLKPRIWYFISLLFLVAAVMTWRYADRYRARREAATAKAQSSQAQPAPLIRTSATNAPAKPATYRLSNTTQKLAQLIHNPHALILRNAWIDTQVSVGLKIPDHLMAKGAPGSYLVQADRPLDKDFYAEVKKAGATCISYVPNNAALVRATPTQATNLAANRDIIVVLPYEPYYKLDSSLLPAAVDQTALTNANLSITTYPGQRDAALAALTQLGARLMGEDRSPFGPTLIVNVPTNSLVAVAQLPLAQEIEAYAPRRVMNDLTRYYMGESTNTLLGTPNYLNLSGAGVTVNINDTGVDATHPDLQGRIIGDTLTDDAGHGTHIAGIIAGSGAASGTVPPVPPGSATNADYRGKASNATIYVQGLDLVFGPYVSDAYLQENASKNLGPTNLISNNSWGYGGITSYDSHAASFDAATRDARPDVVGEQPLLFVFSAGNNGNSAGNITSPGVAKNVITVGAVDSPRFITNLVYEGTNSADTSDVWYYDTSSSNMIADFSSGGPVDEGTEGIFGRFKPDVAAPGVFTISCRSSTFKDPTNVTYVSDNRSINQVVKVGQTNYYGEYIPLDYNGLGVSQVVVVISSNAASPIPFPTNMAILADNFYPPTDIVSSNNFYVLNSGFQPGDFWNFGVTPPSNSPGPVNFNIDIYLFQTNQLGDYFTELSNLDFALGSNYVYSTAFGDYGTSMSAAAVSGMLALMQEFLQQRVGMTNPSPALMKAMLINGSRSLSSGDYDFDVQTTGVNLQGWGMPNAGSCIPAGLTNTGSPTMVVYDQSPSNALATGQYQTFTIAPNTNADTLFSSYPMRITLVWTDPPGNPPAGIALVNNLDLTVVDASGTNIYIGNDFLGGDIFTEGTSVTNLPPGQSDNTIQNIYYNSASNAAFFTTAGDPINNVQNVYISASTGPIQFPLTVTVSGTRVNVNAVTTQTNAIMQDFALVISTDDTNLATPLTVTENPINATNMPLITIASNGVPLLHERVGANQPTIYNFPLSLTNGDFAQWHFFIFTNGQLLASNTTNVAFATFFPPNLSIPRSDGNADIDLYVYAPLTPIPNFTNFILSQTNLDFFANNAVKSVSRTGDQSVFFTNSFVPVYYIGVKSEDQQASDFGFIGVAQNLPFGGSGSSPNSLTGQGTPLPAPIPTSVSPTPALISAFILDTTPLQKVRRVTVDLGLSIGTPGSLYGTLQFDGMDTVLNNFSGNINGFTNVYDDLQEDPGSGDIRSDGPGSLAQYVNQSASGLWLLAEANSSLETGSVNIYTINIDLQPLGNTFLVTIPPESWYDGYVLVPNDATNMIIYAEYESGPGGPIGIYLTNEIGPITTSDYGSNNILPPGGSLSLNTNVPVPGPVPNAPPLAGGFWYYGIYNSSSAAVTLFVDIVIQESLTPNLVSTYTNTGPPIPIITDAHTQSQICISNNQPIVSVQVGLRLQDTNTDDLSISLISPEGTSLLLFENRGGTLASGLGLTQIITNGVMTGDGTNLTTNYSTNYVYTYFTENTNLANTPIKFAPPPFASNDIVAAATLWSNSFETCTNGVYTSGALLEGWIVTNTVDEITTTNGPGYLTNDEVGIVTDPNGELIGTNVTLGLNYLALTSGRIVQTFGTNNSITPFNTNIITITNGMPYEIVFYAKPLGITDWWPADNNTIDLVGTNDGTIPYSDVTYVEGEVHQAWSFDGVGLGGANYNGNEVDFNANVGNFGTNDFTVDFWIKQSPTITDEQACMEKKVQCGYPFNSCWELEIGGGPAVGWADVPPGCLKAVMFSDGFGNFQNCYAQTPINDGYYHNAALVRQGGTVSIYIDGLLNSSSNFPYIADITNNSVFRVGQNKCVFPGVGAPDQSQPFDGQMDDLDLFNRALSPAEIFAIYHAGSLGLYNTNFPPAPNAPVVPRFTLTIDGVSTNYLSLSNSAGGWQLFTNSFIATTNVLTVEFAGAAMGVLLDDIQLIQLPATNFENYYLPEEPLSPLIGENPLGCWTLDIWDTRLDSSQTNSGTLLSWSLQVTTSSTNVVLDVLSNDVASSNVIPTNGIAYFAVDVPKYATYATNTLTSLAGGPLGLYFNQDALPLGGQPGDYTFAKGVTSGNSPSITILSSSGAPPPLLPGQRYFLAVQGTPGSTYTLEVTFNGSTNIIIPLTNAIPYTNIVGTNVVGTNGPQYYSFVAPTNAQMITFQILNPQGGEVDLYARQGLPLPGPASYDYASQNQGAVDQFIVITTNTEQVPIPTPGTNQVIPLQPTTWYLAAYNTAGLVPIQYTIVATVITNGQMVIIPLTNNLPYTNIGAPGYPTDLLYSFTIDNTSTNPPPEVQFTVTNVSGFGNVQLLADLDVYPSPGEALAASYNPGLQPQLIQVITNSKLPSINGTWYMSVPNTFVSNVTYSIMATTNLFVGVGAPPIVPLTWNGLIGSNTLDDNWDILTTSNWVVTTNPSMPYAYQNGSVVTFDDTANGTTEVNLTTTLSPASVIANNNNLSYIFDGFGGINGAPLNMTGSGYLLIDNVEPNNFTSVTIDGLLQVGNNDTSGSLGIGQIDDAGYLFFDRTDTITVPNVIFDSGQLWQVGTDIITLTGNSSYTGGTTISSGTIVVENTNALGSGAGGLDFDYIYDGGTLDLSGLTAPTLPGNPPFSGQIFEIGGAGAGGNGVIVNNGAYPQEGGIGAVLLSSNTTIGGGTRWDINYDNFFDLLILGNYTLTKVGGNQISAISTAVEGLGGSIIINQGIMSFEATPSFSPGVINILVNTNALVGQNLDTFSSFTCPIVLNGGGSTNLSGGGITYLDAPITLMSNAVIGNGGGIEFFDDVISGPANLTFVGIGSNILATNETYTGATLIAQGYTALTNTASISNTVSITVASNATLDASLRVANALILYSNQTLYDNGTVIGHLVEATSNSAVFGTGSIIRRLTIDPGAMLSPGLNSTTIGTLTVSGASTLNGLAYMKLNKALSPSNDVLAGAIINYGGALVVTNLGPSNSFVRGDTFTLFNTGTSAGTFSSIVLPPLPAGLEWANSFGSGGPGIISVVPNTPPAFTNIVLTTSAGVTNLAFSGSNGVPGGQYIVLTTTNLSSGIWTPIETNNFDYQGNFNFNFGPVTNEEQYYILQSP